jgi:hypothetical protein
MLYNILKKILISIVQKMFSTYVYIIYGVYAHTHTHARARTIERIEAHKNNRSP